MMKYYSTALRLFSFLLIVGLSSILYSTFLSSDATVSLALVSEKNLFLGILSLFILMMVTTVIAPLTSLPLVPLCAPIFGPFTTALAAYCGWLCGAIIIFYIARRYGQPFIQKWIEIKPNAVVRKRISENIEFTTLVLLHIVIPNDVLSYAIAMGTRISFGMYISTTALGVIWVPFFLAYGGEALFRRDYVLIGGIGVVSVLIVFVARGILRSIKV